MDELFGGRYKLIEKIGTGGMADVFKAEDTILNRLVSIKMLHPQFAHDENFVARFRREAQAAAGLSHPNIVNVFDWGRHDGTYFIVMEYLEGENLKHIIGKRGFLPPEEAIDIIGPVCEALAFAHKNQIIHRDIKPHNIIVTNDGAVKVTDFGIARAGASTMTQTGSIMGTATYISPEQAQGVVVDKSSDIYSLGVVLFEALTGRVPFEGESPVAVALKQVREMPPSPRSINPDIPQPLETIILKAMAKNPRERYLSAEEMKADLARYTNGMPVRAIVSPAEEKTMIMTSPRPARVAKSAAPAVPSEVRIKTKRRERRKKRIIWALLIIVPIIILFIALVALATTDFFQPEARLVAVPNIKGRPLDEARDILKKRDLKIEIESRVFNDEVASEHILAQDPDWGERVGKESTVRVTVSKGAGEIKVPDVVGKTEAQATYLLAKENLDLGEVKREYSDGAEGIVINQEPGPGARVKRGAPVSITVSKGESRVDVPDVVEKTAQEAATLLGQAGLKMNQTEEHSSSVSKGEIIKQSPSAGTSVKTGSTVTVVVSSGVETVTVPGVVGEGESDAVSKIESNGLEAQVVYESTSTPEDVGKVLSQDPVSGTEVNKNSTVTLKVGQAATP